MNLWQVQTEVMGDIHHFAWRAQKLEQTTYLNARDQERFANWGPEDCVVNLLPLHSQQSSAS